jgi:hypothetical protein
MFILKITRSTFFGAQYRVCNDKSGGKHTDHFSLKELLMLCNFSYGYDAAECSIMYIQL